MPLILDEQPIPGFDEKVKVQGQLEREDQSGDTSGTPASHKGWKAWVVQVSCSVRFEDWPDLMTLRNLYQARDADGQPHLYLVSDRATIAMGITRARFADFFTVTPDASRRVWDIQFSLVEERSIPERTDERAPASPEGLPTTTSAGTGLADTWIERLLALGNTFAAKLLPPSS